MPVKQWIAKLTPLKQGVLGGYLAYVLTLTLAPLPATAGTLPPWTDKLVHFGLFLPIPLLVAVNTRARARGRVVGWAVAVVLAAAIEAVQSRLAFRTGDVWDFAWGSGGASVGIGLAYLYERLIHSGYD